MGYRIHLGDTLAYALRFVGDSWDDVSDNGIFTHISQYIQLDLYGKRLVVTDGDKMYIDRLGVVAQGDADIAPSDLLWYLRRMDAKRVMCSDFDFVFDAVKNEAHLVGVDNSIFPLVRGHYYPSIEVFLDGHKPSECVDYFDIADVCDFKAVLGALECDYVFLYEDNGNLRCMPHYFDCCGVKGVDDYTLTLKDGVGLSGTVVNVSGGRFGVAVEPRALLGFVEVSGLDRFYIQRRDAKCALWGFTVSGEVILGCLAEDREEDARWFNKIGFE